MSLLQQLVALLSGAAVGLVLAVAGGGGSLLATPSLLFVTGDRDVHAIVGTAALAVSMTAWWNLIPHWRSGHVSWPSALVFAVPGVTGAAAGSQVGRVVPSGHLLFLFSLLMLAVAAAMLRPGRAAAGERPGGGPSRHLVLAAAGLLVGLMAGFFGIGGGFLAVPALVLAGRLPPPVAAGTSLLAVGAFALTTGLGYAIAGQVMWPVAIEYALGGVAGGYLGVQVVRRLGRRPELLSRLLGVVLLGVGAYLLTMSAHASLPHLA